MCTQVGGMHDAHAFSGLGVDNALDVRRWKMQCKIVLLSHRNKVRSSPSLLRSTGSPLSFAYVVRL